MDWLNSNPLESIKKTPTPLPPERYSSAQQALDAIIAAAPTGGNYGNTASINWRAAEAILSAELEALELSGAIFVQAYKALRACGFSANGARALLVRYGNSRWSMLADAIEGMAESYLVTKTRDIASLRFQDTIADFPALTNSEKVFCTIMHRLQSREAELEVSLEQLRNLGGDERRARQVGRAIVAAGYRCASHHFALLCAKWAAGSTFGRLQYALWSTPSAAPGDHPLIVPTITRPVEKLAGLLAEFGIGANAAQRHYNLSGLSPAAMTSWREEVAAVVGEDPALVAAAIEALVVFGPTSQDEELLLTAVKLAKHKVQQTLTAHLDDATTLANRRVRACLSLANEAPDVLDLMAETYRTGVAPRLASEPALPRTWLGDARVEELFELSVNELARRVGGQIFDNLHAGEETHLAELFTELKVCLEKLTSQLAFAAEELNAPDRFDFSLSQRIIGKKEEGGPGVDHPRFSADLCLIFKAIDQGVCISQRATLIQAKRLQIDSSTSFTYDLKREQLNDVAEQTLASFLLLLGPVHAGTCLPVMPARLMVDLMKQNASMSLQRVRAAALGKSFGTWLLEDVIGLWTGDPEEALVEKALGVENGRPRLLFELRVQRRKRETDKLR